MNETMFRERALQRVSSPQQLDRAVRATRPLHWLGLAVLMAVVVATVVWASVTDLPTTVTADGEYLPKDGLNDIRAPVTGTVTYLPSLEVGTTVAAGDAVGAIDIPDVVNEPQGASASSRFDVTVPDAGTVVAVNALDGAYVTSGQSLATIEPSGEPFVVYAYLPVDDASLVGPDTEVRLNFGGDIAEDYGSAQGVVLSVSRYATTVEHVRALLNVTAVEERVAELGPASEIVIAPVASATTPSGIAWNRGTGPPARPPTGVPVSVEFEVGSSRPIDKVL
jgi:biotin carboxyl carrier protein